ncbi:hypothetical protein P692DRAFT_20873580 [Suillus brevipes Sb2]|nr:hypothetical protein P692DRAFT_20873580 [Suillus brevipes Sb2]
METSLCHEIKTLNAKRELRCLAVRNCWPIYIDWEVVKEQVHCYTDVVARLAVAQDFRENTTMWWRLMADLAHVNLNIDTLAAVDTPDYVLKRVHPGYFGPKGAATIGDAIVNILDSDETFAPHAPGNMAFFRFIELFLVPCITVLLIEDEFGCSGPDAVTIMYDSADAGELLQPLDDHPELMNIRDGIVDDGDSDDDLDGGRDNDQPQDSGDENDNPFQLQSAAVQWPNMTNNSGASNCMVVAQTAEQHIAPAHNTSKSNSGPSESTSQ